MELKFDSGIPFNPKLITKPKFKLGQTVYGAKNYYSEVKKLEITEVSVSVLWVDNNYRSFYKTTITYRAEEPDNHESDYTEEQLFIKKSQAQFQLRLWKETQRVQSYNYHKEEVVRLEREINSLKKRISDYEQEQGQRTQV